MSTIIYITVLSLGSSLTIFILTKLMGYRQISQMSAFDYITSITIGSIAAEMATALDESFVEPLVAMIVFAIISIVLSLVSSKSVKARKIIEGAPLVLLNNGELYESSLKKAKIDINEFLVQCRVNGYFDLSKLQTAILECDGKISFLPKSNNQPATPRDLGINVTPEFCAANVIIDGKIRYDNLKHTGNDEKWLVSQLKKYGADSPSQVLLATCTYDNTLTVFLKDSKNKPVDILT